MEDLAIPGIKFEWGFSNFDGQYVLVLIAKHLQLKRLSGTKRTETKEHVC